MRFVTNFWRSRTSETEMQKYFLMLVDVGKIFSTDLWCIQDITNVTIIFSLNFSNVSIRRKMPRGLWCHHFSTFLGRQKFRQKFATSVDVRNYFRPVFFWRPLCVENPSETSICDGFPTSTDVENWCFCCSVTLK